MFDYSTQIELLHNGDVVFQAISTDLSDWWGDQDHPIERPGMVFTVSWGKPWYRFEVVDYMEGQRMIWKCVDANQKIPGLEGVEKEWVGTVIDWTLHQMGENHTLLEFKHIGLVPDLICFDFCSNTWNHFLQEKLVNYLGRL